MFLSRNWIKKYVKLADTATAEELSSKLTLSTVEVEGFIKQGKNLDNIVVGKILKVDAHPNADKLKVCSVDVGIEKLTIVCGGSNVAEGLLVAVAKIGAFVTWHGAGELVELKPTSIRGVESSGMICGADEIGLNNLFPKKSEKEILDVTFLKTKPGILLSEALGLNDVILEIDNKSLSNRPDLWGHYGLAREVAVLYNREVLPYKTKKINEGKERELLVKMDEQSECSRFMAVQISKVEVKDSPLWLKNCLLAIGVKPINSIVDVANFVMHDTGQPLHTYDGEKIENQGIQTTFEVRRAVDKEKIITLDGVERELNSETLVVADEKKVLGIAGIIGGKESAISSETNSIIIEAAHFNASSIRKSSAYLGLRTDASVRFEKDLDKNLCELALQKAVELILEISPNASVVSNVLDEYKNRDPERILHISFSFISNKLGISIPPKTIISILKRLGFGVKEKKEEFVLTIPTWRYRDIALVEDVVEEIARMYGYEHISGKLPDFPIVPPEKNTLRNLEYHVRELVAKEFGYNEVYNYSFLSEEQIKKFGDKTELYLELDNPLSKEKPFLRRNLLPGLIENIQKNTEYKKELKLFELGKNYIIEEMGQRVHFSSSELLPRQDTIFTSVYTSAKDPNPFWRAKQILEQIFSTLHVEFVLEEPQDIKPWFHPLRSATILYREKQIGSIFELHPLVSGRQHIENRVGVLEMNISVLCELISSGVHIFKPIPEFPIVSRDFAFAVKKEITHAKIIETLKNIDPLVSKIELFDVYEGKGVEEGCKSMAYHISCERSDKTLTGEEVDAVLKKISKVLIDTFKVKLRS